jgi:putative selenate reductase molybdopterin-binding subunit
MSATAGGGSAAARKRVGHSVPKIDSLALATGQERFTADFPLQAPLVCALLYSPHAHAEITGLDDTAARRVPGVVQVYSYRNVPRVLHTTAGQGFPEPSPYDAVLFDSRVRYVGDRVAMVVAESEPAAREGLARIEVAYRPLDPVFDAEAALEPGAPRLHGGEDHAAIPVVFRPEENLCAQVEFAFGDPEEALASSEILEEHTYRLQAASHCAMEPHAAFAYLDERGRLVVVSATQVPFHARRIVARLLDIPIRQVRVIKPRIGGGFGGKQEVILEPLVGLATLRTGRPARMVLSRREVFVSCRTRHAMSITLRMGARSDGTITAVDMDGLLNSGAYGSHALTVLSNVGSKVLPLFNKVENLRFRGRSAYTNLPVGGAYRGYGATQGYFAFNQQIDMIARRAGQDLVEYCKRWHIKAGETSGVFKALGEGKEGVEQVVRSCGLSECLDRGAEAIGWYQKRGRRLPGGPDRVRGVGLAICMQGSGIPRIDMAAAAMKMNEDGSVNLMVGATDIGTGSDTILAQIAAETLDLPVEAFIVLSSDTDTTPFDTGAYASSTTYVSGRAVLDCATKLLEQILRVAAELLGERQEALSIDEGAVVAPDGRRLPYADIATTATYSENQQQLQAQGSYVCEESPPPFLAQFAEVEVDVRTGRVEVLELVSAADCGRAINPLLVEGQIEGAAVNGISYALCEDYQYDPSGRLTNPRFWDYKIFTAHDLPNIRTILVGTDEPTGPYGAKSIGEVAINGPAPAIANAIYDAVGVRLFELPMTPERVWRAMRAGAREPGGRTDGTGGEAEALP